MKIMTMDGTPGYQLPGDTCAFAVQHGRTVRIADVKRPWLFGAAESALRVQTVINVEPSAMSASSYERSP